MKPVPFKESNANLGSGDNPNTDSMPVAFSKDLETPNVLFTVSCWKPTFEELEEIKRTGEIWLSVMSTPPPPVCLMAFNPYKHYGYESLDLTK
jgi:hypothetical protein